MKQNLIILEKDMGEIHINVDVKKATKANTENEAKNCRKY